MFIFSPNRLLRWWHVRSTTIPLKALSEQAKNSLFMFLFLKTVHIHFFTSFLGGSIKITMTAP